MTSEDLVSEAIHAWRRAELREQLVTASGESLYLRYKDKLDRVLYSLLRVADSGLCQELSYAIEAGEITFAEAATQHSNGPEAKTQGIVGPVDLTTPHPEVAARYVRPILEGMVLTIEPGIYVRPAPGVPEKFHHIGIRIEDDAIVTAQACELISRGVPVAPDDIEALMRA
jgi:hypothetical protein